MATLAVSFCNLSGILSFDPLRFSHDRSIISLRYPCFMIQIRGRAVCRSVPIPKNCLTSEQTLTSESKRRVRERSRLEDCLKTGWGDIQPLPSRGLLRMDDVVRRVHLPQRWDGGTFGKECIMCNCDIIEDY
jgi:hypothetical protein